MQKRRILNIAIFVLTALLLWYGTFVLHGRDYYYVSLGILLVGILGFLLSFEKGRPSLALLTILASLCGLAIASRVAFFFLPQVKPLAAIVILAGVAFGAEAGFVTGAVSAFVSNFYFMQGPWTGFQMFALGLVGFFGGLLFFQGKGHRLTVALYGFFSVIILYGGIVDINTIFFTAQEPTAAIVAQVYLSALPFNGIYGLSTAMFLFLLYQPVLRKLERLQRKYRLIDKNGD